MKATFVKILLFFCLFTILFSFSACKSNPDSKPGSSTSAPILTEYNISPLNYYSIYCTDNKASTEIAVNDDKIYCKWLDNNDQEHISVIENIYSQNREWVMITQQSNLDDALTYFKNYNYQSLKEKVGECIVYTNKNNDFYITDTTADITYDLGINLEKWRRFATNNTNIFAFLSCEPILADREWMYEVRVYIIEKHLSDSPSANKTLLHRITENDNIDDIGGIRVSSSSCTVGSPVINDKTNMTFLQKYTYSHYRTTNKDFANQLLKDKTNFTLEVVTKRQSKYYLYLMQDGSIAVEQMSGDSEVPDITYEFYTADKEHTLTKQKLDLALKENN